MTFNISRKENPINSAIAEIRTYNPLGQRWKIHPWAIARICNSGFENNIWRRHCDHEEEEET